MRFLLAFPLWLLALLVLPAAAGAGVANASNLRRQREQQQEHPIRMLPRVLQRQQQYPWRKPNKLITNKSNLTSNSTSSASAAEGLSSVDVLGNTSHIVGGTTAEKAYPFFGLWDVGCGASLIAPDIMLTAAHCEAGWDPIAGRRVFLGSTHLRTGLERRVVEVMPHLSYSQITSQYDFMLLKLNASALIVVEGTEEEQYEVSTIALNRDANKPQPGDNLQVMGFRTTVEGGFAFVEDLQEVTVEGYDSDCNGVYGVAYDSTVMLCAGREEGGADACQGEWKSFAPKHY